MEREPTGQRNRSTASPAEKDGQWTSGLGDDAQLGLGWDIHLFGIDRFFDGESHLDSSRCPKAWTRLPACDAVSRIILS
jgi:hypothetical protein